MVMTLAEASAQTGIPVNTMWSSIRSLREDRLRSVMVNGQHCVEQAELERWAGERAQRMQQRARGWRTRGRATA